MTLDEALIAEQTLQEPALNRLLVTVRCWAGLPVADRVGASVDLQTQPRGTYSQPETDTEGWTSGLPGHPGSAQPVIAGERARVHSDVSPPGSKPDVSGPSASRTPENIPSTRQENPDALPVNPKQSAPRPASLPPPPGSQEGSPQVDGVVPAVPDNRGDPPALVQLARIAPKPAGKPEQSRTDCKPRTVRPLVAARAGQRGAQQTMTAPRAELGSDQPVSIAALGLRQGREQPPSILKRRRPAPDLSKPSLQSVAAANSSPALREIPIDTLDAPAVSWPQRGNAASDAPAIVPRAADPFEQSTLEDAMADALEAAALEAGIDLT